MSPVTQAAGDQAMPGASVPVSAAELDQLHYGYDPRVNRLFSAFLLVLVVLGLGFSFVLAPSPAGWGTHQKLMLPPCMFHYFSGIPCPFCGMTTAFAHMARGQIAAAFRCNVLGPPMFVLAWIAGGWALYGLVAGKWPLPRVVMSARFNRALIVVLAIAWVVNIGVARM